MKFIEINDEYQIISRFPEAVGFETVQLTHGVSIGDFENCFVILIMGTQGGSLHWTVTHSEIDGPQSTESGTLSLHGHSEDEQRTRMEKAVNDALESLTKGWLPQHLPRG